MWLRVLKDQPSCKSISLSKMGVIPALLPDKLGQMGNSCCVVSLHVPWQEERRVDCKKGEVSDCTI